MTFEQDLYDLLTNHEKATVSDSFGGSKLGTNKAPNFSVSTMAKELLVIVQRYSNHNISRKVKLLDEVFRNQSKGLVNFSSKFLNLIQRIIRFSFLIELTNLSISSTKMKTRWFPGEINKGLGNTTQKQFFQPGNDPRSVTFDECLKIFEKVTDILTSEIQDVEFFKFLKNLLKDKYGVPYQFIFSYADVNKDPIHTADNIKLVINPDIIWLINARPIINASLEKNLSDKIRVKSYLSDRSLTGKDKTNRAKRWEILPDDYQFSSLENCWSVEKKLIESLIHFENFPQEVFDQLVSKGLISSSKSIATCPVTLENFCFDAINTKSEHGKAEYQVGHLLPLKKKGIHEGQNISWQSYIGNRIQGDLSLDEVNVILDKIFEKKYGSIKP